MSKKYYTSDIDDITRKNNVFRKILYTTPTQQLVVMSINPENEIGKEKHLGITQFIKVVYGRCIAIIGKNRESLKKGSVIIIPPNTYHNIINASKTRKLKLYTIYSPPAH